MKFTSDELKRLSLDFEQQKPHEVLTWAVENFWPRLAIGTGFGPEGLVIIDHAMQLNRKIPVFTLNTGFLFKETLELKKKLEERYGIQIESLHPAPADVEQLQGKHGDEPYKVVPDFCCHIRKVVSMRKKQQELDALITGLRRSQGTNARSYAQLLQAQKDPETGHELVKINPLVAWTKEEVWWYVVNRELPYNPLHDKGYPSIGCWPCTQPVLEGEDERAGRWRGLQKKECGLHTFMSNI